MASANFNGSWPDLYIHVQLGVDPCTVIGSMPLPPSNESQRDRLTSERRSLHHVRAAQLRNRALRWAIGKSALGTIFLIGALAYALAPDRQSAPSRWWTALLLILSTVNIGLGLRTFARIRRGIMRYWFIVTAAWAVSATILVRILMRR